MNTEIKKPMHTPEPWTNDSYNLVYSTVNNQTVCEIQDYLRNAGDSTEHQPEEEATANAERIVKCVNACAGIENPAEFIKDAHAAGNNMQTYENLIPQLVEELNVFRAQENEKQTADFRAALKPSKFAILNLQSLDTYKNADGYTETFATESQALDVAHQYVSMFQIITLNL